MGMRHDSQWNKSTGLIELYDLRKPVTIHVFRPADIGRPREVYAALMRWELSGALPQPALQGSPPLNTNEPR